MRNRSGSLSLAGAAGALCLATGIAYLRISPTELPVAVLATCGVLGATSLLGAGIWQRRAGTESSRRALVTVAVLAAGFAAASALGVVGAGIARDARAEPTDLVIALHSAGIATGAILFAVAFTGLVREGRADVDD